MIYHFIANCFFAKLYFQATIEYIRLLTISLIFSILLTAVTQFFFVIMIQVLFNISFIFIFFGFQFSH